MIRHPVFYLDNDTNDMLRQFCIDNRIGPYNTCRGTVIDGTHQIGLQINHIEFQAALIHSPASAPSSKEHHVEKFTVCDFGLVGGQVEYFAMLLTKGHHLSNLYEEHKAFCDAHNFERGIKGAYPPFVPHVKIPLYGAKIWDRLSELPLPKWPITSRSLALAFTG